MRHFQVIIVKVLDARLAQKVLNLRQLGDFVRLLQQVVQREQRMGLAAAKRCLQAAGQLQSGVSALEINHGFHGWHG